MTRPFFIFFICISYFLSAQSLSVTEIPEDLKKEAYAVVRNDQVTVKVASINKVVYTKEYVVTVFDKAGDNYALAYQMYDSNIKINNLEAVYYDKNGKEIKKFRTKDFIDQSFITGGQMYTDTRVKYLNYSPVYYPYTISFKSVTTHSSTFINPWFPVRFPNLAIEKSSFTIENESGIKILSKELNLANFGISSQKNATSKMHYELKNQKAFQREELMPSVKYIYPYVEFSAAEFVIDGVKGSFTNWKELGEWYQTLLTKANDFTPDQKNYFRNLVKDAANDKEKIQILYKHLQNKTRYIGIQLGIGGLKPFPASYVENKSYGDCKALTNYLQSMLDAVGIQSYYTIVQAGPREDLFSDFASIAQGNHVILYVPLENDEIWLEATSQRTAFNFLGAFTENRQALLITPEGGKLIKTQAFDPKVNKSIINGSGEILPDGQFKAQISMTNSGLEYDGIYDLKFESEKDQNKIIKNYFNHLPNLDIHKYSMENDWQNAVFTLNVDLESRQFAKTYGNEMTVNILPIGGLRTNLKKIEDRVHPFEIRYGHTSETAFELKIPIGYKMSKKFQPILFSDDFGTYLLTAEELDSGTLKVHRMLFVKDGQFPKEQYNAYVEFRRKISSFDNTKILLEKTKP